MDHLTATAEEAMSQIRVRNRLRHHENVAGATVTITGSGTSVSGTTNAQGVATLDTTGLANGSYILTVTPEDALTGPVGPATAVTLPTAKTRIFRSLSADLTINAHNLTAVSVAAGQLANGEAEIGPQSNYRCKLQLPRPSDAYSNLRQSGLHLMPTPMLESTTMPDLEAAGTAFERDELAERELLEEMTSFPKEDTGVDNTIFISPKGFTRHAPRIKLAIDPPDSFDPRGETALVMIADGAVVAGKVPSKVLKQVRRFIELNRDVLLDYWNYRIGTPELGRRLKSIKEGR
jgi:hypothetical protein